MAYMNATDINLTFQATFNFLKNYQIDKDGYLDRPNIYTTTEILKDQGTLINEPRQSVFNVIGGIITEVAETYVVVLCELKCGESIKYEQYTIEYNTIINVITSTFNDYKNQYIATLEKLPEILPTPGETTYDILEAFKEGLEQNKDKDNKTLTIIYQGINSLEYDPEYSIVLRNFIYNIQRSAIVPINYVDGFFYKRKVS